MAHPVVLITGASSGIGEATATLLATSGYHVFGTKLPHESISPNHPYTLIDLDVTDPESVAAAVAQVLAQTGRIDVLINNAGVALRGAAEENTPEEIRWQMDVNFMGTVNMVQAVLPTMRQQQSGRIINVASLLGRYASPFAAYYTASKHAVEGFTEALRLEVAAYNIKVSMVEPGFVRTGIIDRSRTAAQPLAEYDLMRARLDRLERFIFTQAFAPELVASAIKMILESRHPRLRYPLFLDAFSRIMTALPAGIRDRVLWVQMGSYQIWGDLPKLVLMGLGIIGGWWLMNNKQKD